MILKNANREQLENFEKIYWGWLGLNGLTCQQRGSVGKQYFSSYYAAKTTPTVYTVILIENRFDYLFGFAAFVPQHGELCVKTLVLFNSPDLSVQYFAALKLQSSFDRG